MRSFRPGGPDDVAGPTDVDRLVVCGESGLGASHMEETSEVKDPIHTARGCGNVFEPRDVTHADLDSPGQ